MITIRILLKQIQPLECRITTLATQLTSPRRRLNKKLQMVSPKALQKLEEALLLDANSHGPTKSHVNRRWMEYQGIRNWEGLLDPLDENLRGEIIRYGHFVDAAYKAFEFDPTSPSYAMCKFPKKSLFRRSGLTELTGYHITKNLHATSGISLPHWSTDRVPRWMSTQSSWMGYVAVCNDKEEIARLGRRDIVIALRGTVTCLEWLENLRVTLTQLPNAGKGPMVESGFLRLYTSGTHTRPSLQNLVREEISKILESYGKDGEPLSMTITGHSLGAALAILTAYDIKTTFENAPLVTVISFGGPRVGNEKFRQHLENQGTKVLRVVNSDDIVTKVPGFVVDPESEPGWTCSLQHFIGPTDNSQWAYADVGCELRLSSRASPYLRRSFDVTRCHHLNTYLHLVNGFVSSTCPFRVSSRKPN